MPKRLRKAPEGTISIKSFFTPLDKPNDGNTSKSSNDSSVTDEDLEDSDVQEYSSDSDWESKPRSRRKRPRKAKSAAKKNVSKLLSDKNSVTEGRKSAKSKTKKDDIKVLKIIKNVETPKPVEKEIDAEVAAFLKSGIPAATCKAQKLVNLRIEDEEFSKTVQYFPVYSHVSEYPSVNFPDNSFWETRLNLKLNSDSFCSTYDPLILSSLLADKIAHFISVKSRKDTKSDSNNSNSDTCLCCKIPRNIRSDENDGKAKPFSDLNKPVLDIDDVLPWIEKYEVQSKSDLAVDGEALEKIETWLRHWKHDIKDDGGKSRKSLEKRKRRNSDSTFVTSEEESEFKSKSLLLYGYTGCGKTGAITTLAKKMGFKVVEVNFSTSRSGKEVLKRVEEATLSHRLESSHASSLLLFKDVCLIEPKEDEGFVAAVAQLITSSCRPIVMTMSMPPYPFYVAGDCDTLLLDVKIEKKDPMTVCFPAQSASTVVKKVLLPIIKSEFPDCELPRHVVSTLYSIARHCKGDIRQSINQAQFLLQTFNSKPIHHFHFHLSPFVDLGFLRKSNANVKAKVSNSSKDCKSYHALTILSQKGGCETLTNKMKCKSKKAKIEILRKKTDALDTIVNNLQFAVELDRVNSSMNRRSHNDHDYDDDIKMGRCQTIRSYFDSNLKDLYLYSLSKNNNSRSPPSSSDGTSQDSGTGFGTGDVDSDESGGSPVQVADTDVGIDIEVNELQSSDSLLSGFFLHSLLFDSDRDAEMEEKVQKLRMDMEDYCGTEGDLVANGQSNFHNFAFFRTIIKTNKLNSNGPQQKRNRRVSYYFNRVGNELVDQVCDTFDFKLDLKIAKQCS